MEPLFIKSVAGHLFALYHAPATNVAFKGSILFVPPFAEELNRSRHMINLQARAFTKAGYGVLILDLYGTGDSEGTFGEASIAIWQQDILTGLAWLKDQNKETPIIWAMRSGALIAADLIQNHPDITCQLILWSPVSDGEKFISQFMRNKLAAHLANTTGDPKTSMKGLWAKVAAGENLAIAGYDVSAELILGFSRIALRSLKLPQSLILKWIEISPNGSGEFSPATKKTLQKWQDEQIDISAYAVNDVQFWTLQEPEEAHEFIKQTLKILEKTIEHPALRPQIL